MSTTVRDDRYDSEACDVPGRSALGMPGEGQGSEQADQEVDGDLEPVTTASGARSTLSHRAGIEDDRRIERHPWRGG